MTTSHTQSHVTETSTGKFTGTASYLLAPDLADAVDIAIALEKPLLIKGEPGTGKTRLAEAIAESLQLPLLTWHVKSTSKAKEGLYFYDAVQRLNDARFGDKDISDIRQYIKYGPLGKALLMGQQKQKCILLVDEIDKADLEFPNDLLHELDRMEFQVDETNETIHASVRPIVLISSNSEKELPDAFLRRCIFHYIAFPDKDLMSSIVKVHIPNVEDALLTGVLKSFYAIRELPEIRKRPSTSELIDWIAALRRAGLDAEVLQTSLPFLGTLLKREQDINVVQQARSRKRI